MEDHSEPLQLRTHTRLWNVEKKMYKFYDFTLPAPVSLRMMGIFFATALPWIGFCAIIGIPFAPPFGHLIWIAPPAMLTYAGSKPVAEGKKLGELLASQASFYVRESRAYAGGREVIEPDTIHLRSEVWRSNTTTHA
jgi:hypothetical protein